MRICIHVCNHRHIFMINTTLMSLYVGLEMYRLPLVTNCWICSIKMTKWIKKAYLFCQAWDKIPDVHLFDEKGQFYILKFGFLTIVIESITYYNCRKGLWIVFYVLMLWHRHVSVGFIYFKQLNKSGHVICCCYSLTFNSWLHDPTRIRYYLFTTSVPDEFNCNDKNDKHQSAIHVKRVFDSYKNDINLNLFFSCVALSSIGMKNNGPSET